MLIDFTIHLFTSYLLFALLAHRLYVTEAIYLTLLLGIFKEQFIDVYYLGNDFSLIDMGGNLVGCILGLFVTFQVK